MYEIPSMYGKVQKPNLYSSSIPLGSSDQSREFDTYVWVEAMLSENAEPAPFLPSEFKDWASQEIGRDASDIHPSEIRSLYPPLSL